MRGLAILVDLNDSVDLFMSDKFCFIFAQLYLHIIAQWYLKTRKPVWNFNFALLCEIL